MWTDRIQVLDDVSPADWLAPRLGCSEWVAARRGLGVDGGDRHAGERPPGARGLPGGRAAGLTIIHSPIAFQSGYHEITSHPHGILKGVVHSSSFIKGSWGCEIVGDVAPIDSDIVIEDADPRCRLVISPITPTRPRARP